MFFFSVKQQQAIGTTMSPTSWTFHLSPFPSHLSILSHSFCLSSLSHTANSIGYLFYMCYNKFPCYSPYISPSSFSPPPMSISLFSMSVSSLKRSESESKVTQLCPTLCDPMDCSLTGFSIHGIFQTRVPEWVDATFSRGSSQLRDWTQASQIAGRPFTLWTTREAWFIAILQINSSVTFS